MVALHAASILVPLIGACAVYGMRLRREVSFRSIVCFYLLVILSFAGGYWTLNAWSFGRLIDAMEQSARNPENDEAASVPSAFLTGGSGSFYVSSDLNITQEEERKGIEELITIRRTIDHSVLRPDKLRAAVLPGLESAIASASARTEASCALTPLDDVQAWSWKTMGNGTIDVEIESTAPVTGQKEREGIPVSTLDREAILKAMQDRLDVQAAFLKESGGARLKHLRGKMDGADWYWSFVYFSVITITTVGYGDILPNDSLSRLLVVLEVLIGWGVAIHIGFLSKARAVRAANTREDDRH